MILKEELRTEEKVFEIEISKGVKAAEEIIQKFIDTDG